MKNHKLHPTSSTPFPEANGITFPEVNETLQEKQDTKKKDTKLITRPSPSKITNESPSFLERIQGDICDSIHPPSGSFSYFMVLMDASTRWSHICLLSSRNIAFSRLLA